MKKRLVILSDLYGKGKSDWLIYYTDILQDFFDITYYDCCKLAQIDTSDNSQEKLHEQFVNGGISKALEQLTKLEQEPINILAFSIGGTIAWKYGIETNNTKTLTCISSTRLRKEIYKPNGKLNLYFGENDEFKPSDKWFKNMQVELNLCLGQNHDMYRHKEIAKQLCFKILNQE